MQVPTNYGEFKYPVLISRIPQYGESLSPACYILKNNVEKYNEFESVWNGNTETIRNLIRGFLSGHISFELRAFNSVHERLWVKFNFNDNPVKEFFKNIIFRDENDFVIGSSLLECNFVRTYFESVCNITPLDVESQMNRIRYDLQVYQIQEIVNKLNDLQLQFQIDQCIEESSL